jgi:hypothetical protein
MFCKTTSRRAPAAAADDHAFFGHVDGRFIVVIYEEVDEDTVVPVTAYEMPEP